MYDLLQDINQIKQQLYNIPLKLEIDVYIEHIFGTRKCSIKYNIVSDGVISSQSESHIEDISCIMYN